MNIATIAGIVIALTLLTGAALAGLIRRVDEAVSGSYDELDQETKAYDPAATKGHKIPVQRDFDAQLKVARKEAARRAAALPRGANMPEVQGDPSVTPTAFAGIAVDPVTAVKIATFHGWKGVTRGMQSEEPGAAQAAGKAHTARPKKSPKDLKPGVDYEFTEITDDMSPAEKRQARIANAKAKSAAVKALKQAGAAADDGEAATPSEASSLPQSAPTPTSTSAARQPVAGVDYQEIAITDDMSPAEIRKARIANAKSKSAALKALKAAGGMEPVEEEVAAPVDAVAPPPTKSVLPDNAPPPPEFVTITDEMSPADIRRARIQNAKMKSSYNKQLKELGIDPASVND